MLAVRHAWIVVFPMLAIAGSASLPVAAQGLDRAVILPGGGDTDAKRIDRSIVSPFSTTRRIVVRPGPDGGSEVVAVGAAFGDAPAAASPAYVAAPEAPAAPFIDIGPLDAVAAPASVPPTGYLDTGPYEDGVVFTPAPSSSFPPD